VVTNEPGDAIDHLRLDGGVRGWLAGWIVEGEISHRHYLRDHHRRDSLDRSRIGVEASWQGWRDRANIVRWLARWSYLPQSDDHGLLFGVEWSDTGGRGLRDFSPATPPFRQLLQRSMPPEMGETQSDGRSNDHQGGGL
jgi:hypothetical protein